MARWKALPEGLDPAVVRFVAELRRLKDETGLSVVQVAERTGYSEASWQRYFGGRALAPREAVEKLVELAAADAATVSALQDVAQEAWKSSGPSAGTAEAPAAEPDSVAEGHSVTEAQPVIEAQPVTEPVSAQPVVVAQPHSFEEDIDASERGGPGTRPLLEERPVPEELPAPRRVPDMRTVLTSVGSALVGAAVTLLIVQPWSASASAPAAQAVAKPAAKAPVSYHCTYTQSGGKWYAGNSTTTSDLVIDGEDGADVAEVQCLLQHAGISAGGIDGSFGPLTLHAVIQEQMAHHIDVDGQVGPQTWAALRG